MKLSEFISKPIPKLLNLSTTSDYHKIPVQLNHALSTEPLVDVSTFGLAAESYYARNDGLNYPYNRQLKNSLKKVWCRKSIAEKLSLINEQLKSAGLELFLLDGYRSIACQQALWDFFMELAWKTLENPDQERCEEFVRCYISDPRRFDPNDFTSWPTHATGGAVDLTLRRIKTCEFLYMGGVFDDPSEISHTRYYEDKIESSSLSNKVARENRRLLFWLMIDAGFANYSYEWWHFDYANQMWSLNRSMLPGIRENLQAIYGLAEESIDIKVDYIA